MRLYVKKFDFWKQLPPLAIIFVSSAFAIQPVLELMAIRASLLD